MFFKSGTVLYKGVVVALLMSFAIGCVGIDDEGGEMAEFSVHSQVVKQASLEGVAELRLPRFHRDWDSGPNNRGICELRGNASELQYGEVTAVRRAIRNGVGCAVEDYTYSAPTTLVTLQTSEGDRSIRFLEKQFTHQELEPGARVLVGTRELDGELIGLGYLIANSLEALDDRRGVVALAGDYPSLVAQFGGAQHCASMTDEEFQRYVRVPDASALDCADEPVNTIQHEEETDDDL